MRPLLLLFFLFILCLIQAQDIIILVNGEELEGIVYEVSEEEIKYKKHSNQSGPMYTMKTDKIFMIKYENGSKDMFTKEKEDVISRIAEELNFDKSAYFLNIKPGFFRLRYFEGDTKINRSEFEMKLREDEMAYSYYSKYKAASATDGLFSAMSSVSTFLAVGYAFNGDNQSALIAAIAGLVTGGISRIYSGKAKAMLDLALITYNKNIQ